MRTIRKSPAHASTRWCAKALLVGTTLASGLIVSMTASAADHVVTALSNMTFSPKTLTINAGDTVTFKNGGGFHNATSDPGAVTTFRCAAGCDGIGGNGNLSSASWSATVAFPTAGTAAFHCEAHGAAGGIGMSGTIVVRAVAARRNDFNGDRRSDVLWRNGSTGADLIWLSANSATKQTVATVADLSWKALGSGDYNGDGRADIFWRNGSTGANVIWLSANSATKQAVATQGVAAVLMGSGDYNGDGRSDILWRNATTGANSIWLSANAATMQAVASLLDPAWTVAGSGDYDGDGRSDILWRNGTTGANVIWRSANSATKQTVATQGLAAAAVGAGDYNGDGRADILWRNGSTGTDLIWLSANAATIQAVAAMPDLSWKVVGSGDYNGDGRSDILWRNATTGANVIWLSANSATKQAVAAQGVAASVAGTLE